MDIFDPRGILYFSNLTELNEILTAINEGKIIPNYEALEINQRIALQFISKELNIYRSLIQVGFLPPLEFTIGDYLSDTNGFLSGYYTLEELLI